MPTDPGTTDGAADGVRAAVRRCDAEGGRLMPALFTPADWLDKLLSSTKKQITIPQTDRIKIDDIVNFYNGGGRIMDKPLRETTWEGYEFISGMIDDEGVYPRPACDALGGYCLDVYPAHLLGKVVITEVYDMIPAYNSTRSQWAKADGFDNFTCANSWFSKRYGADWMQTPWTVIRWGGWIKRYFEPGAR